MAITDCIFDVPEAAPADPAAADLEFRVASVCDLLEQVAGNDGVARALSEAMASIAANWKRTVDSDQLARLLAAVDRAEQGALNFLPAAYPRPALREGFAALRAQVKRWAMTPAAAAAVPYPERADDDDRARILRNACHSFSLAEDIASRAKVRRDDAVLAIISEATRHVPRLALPQATGGESR